MKNKEIAAGLTQGLVAGYAGKTDFSEVKRGGFSFKSSHLETEQSKYHDEWLVANVGGGQEIIDLNGQQFTRLYAGGIVDEEELANLGTNKEEVINFLKKTIFELNEQTRLFNNCQSKPNNDWFYSYTIIDRNQALPITTAREQIFYKNRVVFVHNFLLCPIS